MQKIFSMAGDVKDKIVEVALERFLQYGIRSMTIKKLVEPLGISTKTVYKYFDSKERLLQQCLKVLYTRYYDEFRTVLNRGDNPATKLLVLFRATLDKDFGMSREFFHDLNYYYPELQNAAIESTRENYGKLMVPLIENGIAEGYFCNYLQPELVLDGIVTMYTTITRSEKYRNYEGSPYVLFKNLVEVYIRGLCTEKGLREIENNSKL